MSFARQPLDKILFSGGSVRIMRALLAHGSYLSVPRVAKDTRMAANGVRDVLTELEMAGVVESTGSARARLFKAIPNHPIVASLAALFEAERARFGDIMAFPKDVVADSRYVSILRRFIEAMGGELEITARFPDHNLRIKNFSDLGEREPA